MAHAFFTERYLYKTQSENLQANTVPTGKDGQKVAGTAFALGLTSLRECLFAVFFVGFPPDE